MMKTYSLLFSLMAFTALLSGCGNKGPLVLPPPAELPAPASDTEESTDKSNKSDASSNDSDDATDKPPARPKHLSLGMSDTHSPELVYLLQPKP